MSRNKMLPDLESTIYYMNSADYRDRLIGEYWQAKIRLEKLDYFLRRLNDSSALVGASRELFPAVVSEKDLDRYERALEEQRDALYQYVGALEDRMIILRIDYLNVLRGPDMEGVDN